MNQRLALMSAILANPDDDLPRLVFADWLEENGTTDADAARVEFIRLGCKSKAKSRITPAETKWLDANWRRLLGTTVAATHPKTRRNNMTRDGRFFRLHFRWQEAARVGIAEVVFEYVRGFARRVEYKQGHTYKRFWQAAATDEPLAYHRPELRPSEHLVLFERSESRIAVAVLGATLSPDIWGMDVFERAGGFTEEVVGKQKRYRSLSTSSADESVFHPLVLEDEKGISPGDHRQRAAVATAMTAIAREFVGLDPNL